MQKQEITHFLALQTTYELVEIGLFANDVLLFKVQDNKLNANKTVLNLCTELLKKFQLSLANINFIAVNQGPAPFTSLLVILSTVNGICFAFNILLYF